MSSMRIFTAGNRILLIDDDGRINAPFSMYLNEQFDNPHTRSGASLGLRVLHRFLTVHHIDLPTRALNGECLRVVECKWLAEFAYRPVDELERMSDAMLRRLTTASREAAAMDLKGALAPNTAGKRLIAVAAFLSWYRTDLLNEAIRSAATRDQLEESYTNSCAQLEGRIAGTPQGHHHEIRSLPGERFRKVIHEVVVNPELLFRTEGDKSSSTMMRDQAMVLLAAEGLRPGAIGNLTVDDFRYRPGDPHGYIAIKDNVAKRKTSLTTAVPVAKGARSATQNYNSNILIRLQPFTCDAIQKYLDGERDEVLSRRLANRSKSFLFLADHGGPIGDRTTISLVFSHLAKRLKELGHLNTTTGDPYARGAYYEFSAYTLRHSAATEFYAARAHEPSVKDAMRQRFGWTAKSTSPNRYANRAMSDAASVDMEKFHETLLHALATKKKQRSQPFTEETDIKNS